MHRGSRTGGGGGGGHTHSDGGDANGHGGAGHHHHHHHHHQHGGAHATAQLHSGPLGQLAASSSFTSGTGSSLADGEENDFVSLQNMYELPPMATPPRFDFADLAMP